MDRRQLLAILQKQSSQLRKFGVKSLAVFGSVARDQADSGSDLDVLVVFENDPTFDQYMELKFFLEELTGRSIDLVTDEAIRPQLRPSVTQDAIYVA